MDTVPPTATTSAPAVPEKKQPPELEVPPGPVQVRLVMIRSAPGLVRTPLVRTKVVIDPAQEFTERSALKAPPREMTLPVTLTVPASDTVKVPPAISGEIVPKAWGWTMAKPTEVGGPCRCPGL